jgi:hypothetical protein
VKLHHRIETEVTLTDAELKRLLGLRSAAAVEWRPIPGFPGYEVSDTGRVRSYWRRWFRGVGRGRGCAWLPGNTSREMRFRVDPRTGYCHVQLRRDGKAHQRYLHRLVLEAFRGPCPPGHETRHLDGVRSNNVLTNLAWGTKAENEADRHRHGTVLRGDRHPSRLHPERLARGDRSGARLHPERYPRGGRHHSAKLSDGKVFHIKRRLAAGEARRALAREYGVDPQAVNNIAKRKTWSHVHYAASSVPFHEGGVFGPCSRCGIETSVRWGRERMCGQCLKREVATDLAPTEVVA